MSALPMTRRTLSGTLGLAAMLALAAILPAASPAALVPPGNSAVNQYTETYPAAGGQAESDGDGGGGSRSPAAALGSRNARRLQAQGADGRAAASLAAATAPARVGASGEGAAGGGAAAPGGSAATGGPGSAKAGEPSGSSGLAEVLGQATGSSDSGGIGLLLPIVILATLVWSLAYLARRRRRPTA
jgi:hypothetical protein